MKLKASTDYGIRIVFYLALNSGVCSSKDISHAISVPRDYLIQLAQLLRNAGIVEARSGKNGGYSLARKPSDITLLEVINSVDEASKHASDRFLANATSADPLVGEMRNALDLALTSYEAYLNGITVETLMRCADDPVETNALISQALMQESARLLGYGEEESLDRMPLLASSGTIVSA